MAPDSFKNLGFGDDADAPTPTSKATTVTPSQQQPQLPQQDTPRKS